MQFSSTNLLASLFARNSIMCEMRLVRFMNEKVARAVACWRNHCLCTLNSLTQRRLLLSAVSTATQCVAWKSGSRKRLKHAHYALILSVHSWAADESRSHFNSDSSLALLSGSLSALAQVGLREGPHLCVLKFVEHSS
jgi:hypothetical protein